MRIFLITILLLPAMDVAAQVTTAFTYQGELEQAGNPATGEFDFEFELFDAESGGTVAAGPVTVEDVLVDGGLFATQIDFGMDAFGGTNRWLEVRVREGTSTGEFTTLSPRQPITPAPLALALVSPPGGSSVFVGPAEFRARSAPSDFSLGLDYLAGQAIAFRAPAMPEFPESLSLVASVDLPDGVEITQLECFLRDNDPDADLLDTSAVNLNRVAPDSDTTEVVTGMTIFSIGSPGHFSFIQSSINHPIVDNANFHYVVTLTVVLDEIPDFFDPQFRGCRISFNP